MAKKKESVGVIKPKRVVKKSSEVDATAAISLLIDRVSFLEGEHEGLRIKVDELERGMVSKEVYNEYVRRTDERLNNINARVSAPEDDRLILKYSFFARIKWLFTGKVDAPKWR